jgi:hypothetical protein
MNYFAHFDRYVIGKRNGVIRREVQTLRLESQLRRNRVPRSGSRLASLVLKSMLPPLRRAGIAG